jgi:hypothetical protein
VDRVEADSLDVVSDNVMTELYALVLLTRVARKWLRLNGSWIKYGRLLDCWIAGSLITSIYRSRSANAQS